MDLMEEKIRKMHTLMPKKTLGSVLNIVILGFYSVDGEIWMRLYSNDDRNKVYFKYVVITKNELKLFLKNEIPISELFKNRKTYDVVNEVLENRVIFSKIVKIKEVVFDETNFISNDYYADDFKNVNL